LPSLTALSVPGSEPDAFGVPDARSSGGQTVAHEPPLGNLKLAVHFAAAELSGVK
jgi:hypothetical protein